LLDLFGIDVLRFKAIAKANKRKLNDEQVGQLPAAARDWIFGASPGSNWGELRHL
jgi:hypothetical protein